jgi:hypothetical protein
MGKCSLRRLDAARFNAAIHGEICDNAELLLQVSYMPPMQLARLWVLARVVCVETELRCASPHKDAADSFTSGLLNDRIIQYLRSP